MRFIDFKANAYSFGEDADISFFPDSVCIGVWPTLAVDASGQDERKRSYRIPKCFCFFSILKEKQSGGTWASDFASLSLTTKEALFSQITQSKLLYSLKMWFSQTIVYVLYFRQSVFPGIAQAHPLLLSSTMDLIGDIVERTPAKMSEPVVVDAARRSGFPEIKRIDFRQKRSRFKSDTKPKSRDQQPAESSEAQRIHEENMKKISLMTVEEISAEKEELLASLDPKFLQALLKRTEARNPSHESHKHAEGHEGWIGGGRNGTLLPQLDEADVKKALGVKSVLFAEEDTELFANESHIKQDKENGEDTEIAPDVYQLVEDPQPPTPAVHFPVPKSEGPDLDINDPEFYRKLHEKYYPDLPKETSKLAWMTTPVQERKFSAYESISDMRFDFKGDLIELDEKSQDIPTYMGLHHHSDKEQLAGYTIPELVHFSRSVVPTQRCLGIQVLGRILHKIGLHKYNIVPLSAHEEEDENPAYTSEIAKVRTQFEDLMWDLLAQVRAIDSIVEASDELKTRNLSVRNYALEALWLWKKGGGRVAEVKKTDEYEIAENICNKQ